MYKLFKFKISEIVISANTLKKMYTIKGSLLGLYLDTLIKSASFYQPDNQIHLYLPHLHS